MDWEFVLDNALTTILIPLLPLLGVWAITWVNRQIKNLKEKNDREYFDYHLDKVNDLIEDVVIEVQQVYVEALKDEHIFTKEKQLEVFNLAKDKILNQLTIQATEVLEKTYNDYIAWIETQIERTVNTYN